ncbi:hypothetical protein P0Y35_11790 [Kiritimatiellaeota bacterium B1221]|nr:hypothetical protein [Kiritimatiellaeota bacterium B1221]
MLNVNENTIRRLSSTMDRLEKETKRDAKETVKYMALQTSISLGAGSKKSKKNREFDHREDETVVKIYRQNKPPRYISIYKDSPFYKEELKKAKEIKQSGLAKRSWKFAQSLIGNKGGSGGKVERKNVNVKKELSSNINPSLTLTNKLDYIEKAYPNIVEGSIKRALNKVNKILDKKASKYKNMYK